MKKPKAQSSVEYLMITAFVLVIIVVIFALSIITTDQNIKTRQKSESLERLVQTADLVYAMGKGNVLFAEVNWPNEVTEISLLHMCKTSDELAGCNGETQVPTAPGPGCSCTAGSCTSGEDCIKHSAIKLSSGDAANDLVYSSKARLSILETSWCPGPNEEPFRVTGENYEIKVSVADTGIVLLERYCG